MRIKRLARYVLLSNGANWEKERLRTKCQSGIAWYWMVCIAFIHGKVCIRWYILKM